MIDNMFVQKVVYMILKGTILNHVQVSISVWGEMDVAKQPTRAKLSRVG